MSWIDRTPLSDDTVGTYAAGHEDNELNEQQAICAMRAIFVQASVMANAVSEKLQKFRCVLSGTDSLWGGVMRQSMLWHTDYTCHCTHWHSNCMRLIKHRVLRQEREKAHAC